MLIAGAAMPPLTLAKCCGVWHAEAILSLFSIGRVRCDLERADAGQCFELAASMGCYLQRLQTHGWFRMETKLTDPWRPHNAAVEGGSRVCCLGSNAALLCRSELLQLFHHSEHTNNLYFAGQPPCWTPQQLGSGDGKTAGKRRLKARRTVVSGPLTFPSSSATLACGPAKHSSSTSRVEYPPKSEYMGRLFFPLLFSLYASTDHDNLHKDLPRPTGEHLDSS